MQRAKALHPDLQPSGPAAHPDPDAFLRLVAAYDVLSDTQERQLYDASRNSSLPNILKKTAAAAAAASGNPFGEDRRIVRILDVHDMTLTPLL
jgi:DnaJ-class molecular chaperone